MKKRAQKQRLGHIKASRGIERRITLDKGATWVRPTMTMNLRTNYQRSQQKNEVRKLILEYKEERA